MSCCGKCEDREEMVRDASAWMNNLKKGERRAVMLTFEDNYVAVGKFVSLHDGYFTFHNENNYGPGAPNSSDRAWRYEDHPYGMVKRIQRDYFGEYKGYGE